MNLFKFLTRNDPTLGIEISDSNIRLVFLNIKKDKKAGDKIEAKSWAEVDLPEGVIVGGKINKKEIFTETLASLLKKIRPKIKYAIVSIPYDNVYSKLFSFPKIIGVEKLKDTMRTFSDFQSPYDSKNSYSDWEEKGENENYLAFLAASSKQVIDGYIEAIFEAGVSPIAIETHQMSIVRIIKNNPEKSFLSTLPYKSGVLAFIFKNGIIRFSRFLPAAFVDKKSVDSETRKMIDFYKSESGDSAELSDVNGKKQKKIGFVDQLVLSQEINNNPDKWLVAIGAALRGIMPRSEDALVSLMPVGTEEAYENQKAIAFTKFISNTVAVVSLFFAAIYFACLFLIISIGKNFSSQISALNTMPVEHDVVKLENDAKNFNGLVSRVNGILDTMPEWSFLVEELRARSIDGISISNLSLPDPAGQMTMVGTAANRSQLNLYKKSLEESPWLTGINMPLTNLAQKEKIPFSVSFQLKEPSSLSIK